MTYNFLDKNKIENDVISCDYFGNWGVNALCGLCVYTKMCNSVTDKMLEDIAKIREEKSFITESDVKKIIGLL